MQRQARAAYQNLESDISRVKALVQAVKSTVSAKEAIDAGFQVGTRTSVDVLNAERRVFEARRDLAFSRYDYIINRLTPEAGGRDPVRGRPRAGEQLAGSLTFSPVVALTPRAFPVERPGDRPGEIPGEIPGALSAAAPYAPDEVGPLQ